MLVSMQYKTMVQLLIDGCWWFFSFDLQLCIIAACMVEQRDLATSSSTCANTYISACSIEANSTQSRLVMLQLVYPSERKYQRWQCLSVTINNISYRAHWSWVSNWITHWIVCVRILIVKLSLSSKQTTAVLVEMSSTKKHCETQRLLCSLNIQQIHFISKIILHFFVWHNTVVRHDFFNDC
jgi:hypothetical protein